MKRFHPKRNIYITINISLLEFFVIPFVLTVYATAIGLPVKIHINCQIYPLLPANPKVLIIKRDIIILFAISGGFYDQFMFLIAAVEQGGSKGIGLHPFGMAGGEREPHFITDGTSCYSRQPLLIPAQSP